MVLSPCAILVREILTHLITSFTDLSTAKRKFAESLNEFKFQCIGDAETDDEICIGKIIALFLFNVCCSLVYYARNKKIILQF